MSILMYVFLNVFVVGLCYTQRHRDNLTLDPYSAGG